MLREILKCWDNSTFGKKKKQLLLFPTKYFWDWIYLFNKVYSNQTGFILYYLSKKH